MKEALLDTSVFIGLAVGRPVDAAGLPEESLVSIVTLAELQVGVLTATDVEDRARRLHTAQGGCSSPATTDRRPVRCRLRTPPSVPRPGRSPYGRQRPVDRQHGRGLGLPVVAQDDDFDVLAELGLVEVVKV